MVAITRCPLVKLTEMFALANLVTRAVGQPERERILLVMGDMATEVARRVNLADNFNTEDRLVALHVEMLTAIGEALA